MNKLSEVLPVLIALAATPACESKTSQQIIPESHTAAATLPITRTHDQGTVWRYFPDGLAPAIEETERGEGVEVSWIKHPETEGGPSGIVVKVRGKVAYTMEPTDGREPECGIATPAQAGATRIPCPLSSERTRAQREAANATYYGGK